MSTAGADDPRRRDAPARIIVACVGRELEMIWAILLSCALEAGATSRTAAVQEATTAAQAASPSQQLEELQKEYDDAQDALIKAVRALPEKEQGAYYNAHKPDAAAFAKRFRALADAQPKSPVAAQALAWIVHNGPRDPAGYEAFEKLLSDHASSAELGRACMTLRYDDASQVAALLDRARTQSPSAAVRGKASYALAQYYARAAERSNTAGDSANGTTSNRSELGQRAEALFEEIVRTYADEEYSSSRKLGDAAQAALFERRELAIGKIAPEIAAEDLDGNTFKLSDYRGKVVVIDFWGNW
jgi:hypothetical protein